MDGNFLRFLRKKDKIMTVSLPTSSPRLLSYPIALIILCLFSVLTANPQDINHELPPYYIYSTCREVACHIKNYNNTSYCISSHSDENDVIIKFKDKKEKQKIGYKKFIKKEYTKSAITNKTKIKNKVNHTKTPYFLSHFHFATADQNADRGCKNKFI